MQQTPPPRRSRRPWRRLEIALFLAPFAVLVLSWGAQKFRRPEQEQPRVATPTSHPYVTPSPTAIPFISQPSELPHENVLALEFAPNGQSLFSVGKGHSNLISTNSTPWFSLKKFKETTWLYAIAYSPDGKIIAKGGADNRIQFISARTGDPIREQSFEGQDSCSVHALSYSPDGKYLAVGRAEANVSVWSSQSLIQVWETSVDDYSSQEIQALSYSPDGGVIAGLRSSSSNGTADKWNYLLTFWDAATGNILRTIEGKIDNHGLNDSPWAGSEPTASLAYSPDGRMIAVNWSGVTLLDSRSGRVLYRLPHPGTSVCRVTFSHDGAWLATGGATTRTAEGFSAYEVIVWDARTHSILRRFNFQDNKGGQLRGQVTGLRFSPNGKTLVACVATNGSEGNEGQILHWDLSSLQSLRRSASTHKTPLSSLAHKVPTHSRH